MHTKVKELGKMDPLSISAAAGKMAVGKGLGAIVEDIVAKHRRKCREEFIQHLADGDVPFDPEVLKKREEFVYFYAITEHAAEKAAMRAKIRILSNLLKSALYHGRLSDAAEYEDYVKIIDELSIREFILLFILQKYEQLNPYQDGENSTQRAWRYWSDFLGEATKRFGVSEDEVTAMLGRTVRSGCYDYEQGVYGGNSEKAGCLTPIYFKLVRLIAEEREALLDAGPSK
jgi:hypothetical protein